MDAAGWFGLMQSALGDKETYFRTTRANRRVSACPSPCKTKFVPLRVISWKSIIAELASVPTSTTSVLHRDCPLHTLLRSL